MEEIEKNKKVYIYSYIISFIVILVLFSLFIYKSNENNTKIAVDTANNSKEIIDINNSLISGKFKDVIDEIEKKGTGSMDREEKMKLVYSYLNYGNYFYKEQENSKKAMDILNTLDEDSEVIYYKWYSQEIIKNYTGAMDYYNRWLEIKDITDKNKSLILNQIWHLYDLKWETQKTFDYYREAYNLDNTNYHSSANIWRYFLQINKISESIPYFVYALNTEEVALKSEIYFTLSSIELEANWLKPNIDKSISFAMESIKSFPDYPMWYIGLARWLYMKNDKTYDKEIEEILTEALRLNPNISYAYEILALHEYDKWDINKSLDLLKKALSTIDQDMILMDNERKEEKNLVEFKIHILSKIADNKDNKDVIFTFFDEINKIAFARKFLKQQVQRPWYWFLNFLSNEEKFQVFVKNL